MAVANLSNVPQLSPVKSRHIEAQAYDPATQDLYLQFRGGRLYRYPKVSPALYQDFMAAESKGKFFGANIKDAFPEFEKLGIVQKSEEETDGA